MLVWLLKHKHFKCSSYWHPMNQRQIGGIVTVIGILLAVVVAVVKFQEDATIDRLIEQQGSCYLEDGTCLHERSPVMFIVGSVLSGALIVLGVYLFFFDRTQRALAEHQVKVSSALQAAQEKEKEKDEFQAFLAAFSKDEQDVLRAVREQEGILQSTLRFRTGISKTALSLMLRSLEDRAFIHREEAGKTKKVYLKKKF